MSITENLTLTNQFEIVNAITQFNRLSSLDRVWTNYLEQAEPPIPNKDISELETIVENMILLLEESKRGAEYLTILIYEYQNELTNEFENLMQNSEFSEDSKLIVRETVERNGGIVEFSEQSIRGIMKNAYSETETLESKISIIKNGEFTSGDLSKKFLCSLAGGMISGSFGAPFPVNIAMFGAGAWILIEMERDGDGC